MYGKLNNGQLTILPKNYITEGGMTICNFDLMSESAWREHGFKPVIWGNPPDNINSWRPVYQEKKNKITVEKWELIPPDVDDLAALAFVQSAQSGKLDNAAILENAALFPIWDENFRGKQRTIVQHEGDIYRLIHDVTNPQENKEPSKNSTVWEHIGNPNDEFLQWFQPIGINDAYFVGSKVFYDDKNYESIVENNIWRPDVYGWEEVE
jgi:hypothetical protein